MKEILCSVKSLLISDFPIQAAYITAQFASTQQRHQYETPEWSTNATRQKLISQYWFAYVPVHFALIIGLPFLTVFLTQIILQSEFYALSILIAGLLSYAILYVFLYRPSFSAVFLPRLETVKEAYERKQVERLEKCRQAQLSNFSLVLVMYVLDKCSRMNTLRCSPQSAILLTQLFGVDSGSIKKSLALIYGKRNVLSVRKNTEMRNRFEEAVSFFEQFQFQVGIEILKKLEQKLCGAQAD